MGFLRRSLTNFYRTRRGRISGLKALCSAAITLWLIHSLINFERKIPQGDEVDILLSDEALYRTGNTSFSYDSLGEVYPGNWHPPLRWLLIQVFMRLGLNAFQSSLGLNLLSGFATIVATWWLGYYLARHEKLEFPSELGTLSVVLLCTIPLFQAGSGIIDIDNGVLTGVMNLYLAMLLGTYEQGSRLKLFLLGFAFGIVLLTKMSTPLILIPLTLVFFWSKQGSIKKALRSTGPVLLIGFLLFALIFGITRPMFGGPWYEPFLNNYSSLLAKWQPHTWKEGFFRTIAEFLLWIGPPAGVFVILAIKNFCWPFHGRWIRPVPALLLGYSVGIWCVYAYLGVTFNLRYMIPSLAAFAAVSAFLMIQGESFVLWSSGSLKFKVLIISVLMLAVALLLLPDPILYVKLNLRYDFWRAAVSYGISLFIVCLGAYFVLRWFCGRGFKTGNFVVTWLAFIWLVFNLNTSIKQIAGNYQLGYGYGLSEYNDVVHWLKEHAQNVTPIFALESFVWLLRGTNYTAYKDRDLHRITNIYKGKRQPSFYYFVLERRNSTWTGEALTKIMAESEEVYQNKDFLIVRKNF